MIVSHGEYKNVLQKEKIWIPCPQETDIQKEILPQAQVVNMSWLSDAVSYMYGGQMNSITSSFKQWGLGNNDVARFFEDEANKANLRGSEVEGVLTGLPVVGDIIRGVEGVNQMEDLYRNTGKVPNYPGAQNLGSSALAHVPGDMSRKIEGGSHDLAEFYSGDRDINSVFDRINGSIPRAFTSKSGETGWTKVI